MNYTSESLQLLTDAQLYALSDMIQATTISVEDRNRCFPLLMAEHKRRMDAKKIVFKRIYEEMDSCNI